jgi:CRP-like cAMP-binding protein
MTRSCPDCPANRARLLEPLVERESGCAFRCLSVGARQALPARWHQEHGLALVRRGIVVRQRVDVQGRSTAIDVAGPGSVIPLGLGDEATAYACNDVMLCLCPTGAVDDALDGGLARDVVKAQSAVLARVERIAEARGRASTTARVAGLVLAITDTLTPVRLEAVPAAIQQRDLAALLATRHESVCRAISQLVRSGALERGALGLRVLDRQRLDAA